MKGIILHYLTWTEHDELFMSNELSIKEHNFPYNVFFPYLNQIWEPSINLMIASFVARYRISICLPEIIPAFKAFVGKYQLDPLSVRIRIRYFLKSKIKKTRLRNNVVLFKANVYGDRS